VYMAALGGAMRDWATLFDDSQVSPI